MTTIYRFSASRNPPWRKEPSSGDVYMEEDMTEDKPILKWALRFEDGSFSLYDSRREARVERQYWGTPSPSVVRVQITVLKDRK